MINMIKMLGNVNIISNAFCISSSNNNLSRFLSACNFFINENATISHPVTSLLTRMLLSLIL